MNTFGDSLENRTGDSSSQNVWICVRFTWPYNLPPQAPLRRASARWWADRLHPEDAMSLEQLSSCLKQHCSFWAAIDFLTWSESAPVLDYIVQRHPHQFETAEFMALFRWDTSKHENFKTRMLGNLYLFIFMFWKNSKNFLENWNVLKTDAKLIHLKS